MLNTPNSALLGSVLLTASSASASLPYCVDFDPPPAPGTWACCGVNFHVDGIGFQTAPFVTIAGVPLGGGQATIVNSCNGAGGHSLWLENVDVIVKIFDFNGAAGVRKLEFWYEDFGGSVNLMINGVLINGANDFRMIPPAAFAGVGATINDVSFWTGASWRGRITIEALAGSCINDLAIGGQELCIDDLCALDPCHCPEDVDGDHIVGFGDLIAVLGAWGPCPGCPGDVDGNGFIDFADVLRILSLWGAPC